MATLAPRGRIRTEEVEEEITRLRESWHRPGERNVEQPGDDLLEKELLDSLDAFDRVQLLFVVDVCRKCRSLSEAGREVFNVSRTKRTVTNDADRLKKYLKKFGLTFESVSGKAATSSDG